MFSHVTLGVSDFDRAYRFHAALMEGLGYQPYFKDDTVPWAAWNEGGRSRPLYCITAPFDGGPASAGNGQMVALLAPNRAQVDAAYHGALAHGGTDEGEPGLRPHYHPNYYGAYFRDPDGNKLCVVCHEPEG